MLRCVGGIARASEHDASDVTNACLENRRGRGLVLPSKWEESYCAGATGASAGGC